MPNITDIFKTSAALRDQLTEEQSKEIQKMYEDMAKKIAKQAKDPKYQLTQSGILQQQYLSELQKQIEAWSKELSNGLYTQVQSTMNLISDAVVQDNVEWLHSLGLGDKKGLSAAFSNVNQSVVNAIMTGSVYGNAGSWSLSKSIWGDNEKNLQKIYSLIAEGYAAQMPVGDIADMISQYVDPKRKLDWTGTNGKRIYGHKVDYNAQRLVRTLSQHTYQQSLVKCTQDNPFITGFVWVANGSRVCDLCKKRDGKFFKKDELPLDHPNGMCVMRPAVKKDMTQDLAGWVKGTNKNPEIDAFAKKLGYDPSSAGAGMTLGDIKKKYGNLAVGKKIGQFQSKLPKDVQDQLKKFKQDSGMSWDDFFTQNFDGAVSEKVKAVKKASGGIAKSGSTSSQFDGIVKEYFKKLQDASQDFLYTGKMTKEKFLDSLDDIDFDDLGKLAGKLYNMDVSSGTKKDKAIMKLLDDIFGEVDKTGKYSFVQKYGKKSTKLPKKHLGDVPSFDNELKKFLKANDVTPGDFFNEEAIDDLFDSFSSSKKGELFDIFKKYGKTANTTKSAGVKSGEFNDAISQLDLTDIFGKDAPSASSNSWLDRIRRVTERQMFDEEKNIRGKLPAGVRNGMRYYSSSSGCDLMNAIARDAYRKQVDLRAYCEQIVDGTVTSLRYNKSAAKKLIAMIDEYSNVVTHEDKILRRGCSLGDLAGNFMQGDYSENLRILEHMSVSELRDKFVGAVGQYNAPTSTSSMWERGFGGDVEIIFNAPKGTHGASIFDISYFGSGEGEFQLAPQTRCIITDIQKSDGHMGSKIRIFMDVLV